MKKINVLVLLISLTFLFASCSKEDKPETAGEEKQGETKEDAISTDTEVASFLVKYKIEGGMMDGTVTTIAKDENFKTSVVFDMMGQKLETVTFSSGDSVFMMMDMGVVKQNIVMGLEEFKGETGDDPTQMNVAKLQEELKKHTKLGTETILDKVCQIYDLGNGMLMSVYDDKIPLKIQSAEMTLVATEYEMNPSLPDDTFKRPEGVEFKSIKSMEQLGE